MTCKKITPWSIYKTAYENKSTIVKVRQLTDFVREERSDSQRVERLVEFILRKPRPLQQSTLRTVRDFFSEINLVSSSLFKKTSVC